MKKNLIWFLVLFGLLFSAFHFNKYRKFRKRAEAQIEKNERRIKELSSSIVNTFSYDTLQNLYLKNYRNPKVVKNAENRYVIHAHSSKVFYEEGERVKIHYGTSRYKRISLTSYELFDAISDKKILSRNLKKEIHFGECYLFSDAEGCRYKTSIDLRTPTAGEYYLVLHSNNLKSQKVFFGVRNAESYKAEVVLIYPNFTWQAYNPIGGGSYYTPFDNKLKIVSFKRPIRFEGQHGPEATIAFAKELNKQGQKYLPISNWDLHSNKDILKNKKLIIINGHDEYWTESMKDNVLNFYSNNGNALVMGGNTFWYKVQVHSNQMFMNKSTSDVIIPKFKSTGLWLRPYIDFRSERIFASNYLYAKYPIQRKLKKNKALELGMSSDEYDKASGFKVTNSNHPIYAATGFKDGDIIGDKCNILETELDGLPLKSGEVDYVIAKDAPRDIKILGTGKSWNGPDTRIEDVALFVDASIGKARVVHLGSVGVWRALKNNCGKVDILFKNGLNYLLRGKN